VTGATEGAAARPARPRALALLVGGALFMEMLDGTIVATAVPQMAQSFAVAPVDLNLGMTAYLLTVSACIPLSGWATDRFGARRAFCTAVILFALASLACGASQNFGQFVAARIVQGLGGALMMPVGRLVVLRSAPRSELMRTMSLLTWPALLAPTVAPVLGGMLVDHASWRWIFYINLPLGAVALGFALALMPGRDQVPPPPLDLIGLALWAGTTASLILALEGLFRLSAAQLALLLGLAIVLGALAWRHFARRTDPLLDFGVLRWPSFALAIRSGSLFRTAIMSNPFLLPLFFQLGLGMRASDAGLLIAAGTIGNIGMKPLTSPILRRFGFRRVLLVNGWIAGLSFVLCGWIAATTPLWATALLLIASGASRSLQFTALNTIAFVDVPGPETANANTLFSAFMQLNGAAGVALGAAALQWGGMLLPEPDLARDFAFAFAVIGVVMLLGTFGVHRLHRDAGALLTRAPEPAL
jgi:EmrB/QacA subfamily drug resistance transporter